MRICVFSILLRIFCVGLLTCCGLAAAVVDPAITNLDANLPYKSGETLTAYEKERCFLDIYSPAGVKGFASLIWLHGGSITGGSKDNGDMANLARLLNRAGIALVAINYRLSPNAVFPAYVEDTAAVVAWVHAHIAERGGDPRKIFLGGHSAGAYLSSLVAMDTRYLQRLGLNEDALAGLIPVSGQMMTHFTVRKERGIEANTIIADEAAPIFFTRRISPPFLIIMGDHDWPARWEENLYFAAVMKAAGNERVTTLQVPDRDHGSIAGRLTQPNDPAGKAILEFIARISAERVESK
jgi:acetyl esterase/lipase